MTKHSKTNSDLFIGQRVKVVKATNYIKHTIGYVGEISKIEKDDDTITVDFDGGEYWHYATDDLESVSNEEIDEPIQDEQMKNPILNWSYDKPTEEGLYIACRGDCETIENIQPFRLVDENAQLRGQHPWPTYDIDFVASWHQSFKFAKLCVGAEAKEMESE